MDTRPNAFQTIIAFSVLGVFGLIAGFGLAEIFRVVV